MSICWMELKNPLKGKKVIKIISWHSKSFLIPPNYSSINKNRFQSYFPNQNLIPEHPFVWIIHEIWHETRHRTVKKLCHVWKPKVLCFSTFLGKWIFHYCINMLVTRRKTVLLSLITYSGASFFIII